MRVHLENLTADDGDVLGGTSLDQLEAGGQLDILVLSTQADTVISVSGPDNEPIVQNGEIPQETRALRPTDDLGLSLVVPTGGHYTVDINIVTAATVQFMGIYRKSGVDF
jgi:hypothetical protein